MRFQPSFSEVTAIIRSDRRFAPICGRDAFIAQAAPLLVDEPARCDELAELYASLPEPHARTMIVDLLVTAGSEAAQVALVRVLAQTFGTPADPLFLVLFRRLALLERPTAAVATFAREVYFDSQGKLWIAAAHTVGALIAGLARNGLGDAARNLAWILGSHLSSTSNPFIQTALLQALGLARRLEDLPFLLAFAGATNPSVRRAAHEGIEATRRAACTTADEAWTAAETEDTVPCGRAIQGLIG